MMVKRIGELEHIMANLIQVNRDMDERLDKHRARLYTLKQLDIPQQVSIVVSEVVTDAVDWAMQASLRNRFRDLPEADIKEILHQRMWETESYKTHEDHKQLFEALEKSMNHLKMDEDMGPDEQAQLSDDKDIGSAYVLEVNLRQGWWKPLEEKRPATPESAWSIPSTDAPIPPNNWASPLASSYSPPPEDSLLAQTGVMATFIDWFCKRRGITELKPQNLEGPTFKIIKISFGLMRSADTILLQCMTSLTGGQGQRFYIDLHTSEGDCSAVRTHIRILSIVRIEVFSMYGYDYMKKIVLRRADLNEHVIAERDFKYLYPSNFEDLYLLNLQGHLNHLPSKYKKILTTAVNQWTRQLVIRQRDKYEVQMMMRFNEIHKFSDGTLQQIDEALDYRVKEFRIKRMNPGLNTRFWTRKDVYRCNAFMFAIQRHLRTRRIFCNLESFVGGRVREGDYRLLNRTD
nr:hypothetical protein [Tanacetum cinerariifolium]